MDLSLPVDAAPAEDATPLRLRGDWGGANLTRVCGWLANWVWKHTDRHRLSVIHTGRGMGDNLRALTDGEVDVAVITPESFARLAATGRGQFAGHPMPELRAIATLPHRDAMLFAARADLDIADLGDLARRRLPLRLAVGNDDPDGFMGFGAALVLSSAGLSFADIEAWGGSVRKHEEPFGCLADLREGRVDAIIAEAVMTPDWVRLANQVPLRFVSLTAAEQARLADEWDLGCIRLAPDYLPGMTAPTTTLDYSNWLVVTTAALPDETAELLARAVVDNAETLENQYRHLPVQRSPLAYPITVDEVSTASIPLHPAVDRVYRSRRRS